MTTVRNEYGSQTPGMDRLSNGYKALISRWTNELRATVDEDKDAKFCPRCERTRYYKFFGTRVMREARTGKPLKVIWQSYCTECRSLKPDQKPKTKKAAKAKKGAKAKVQAQVAEGTATVVAESPAESAPPEPVVLGAVAPEQAPVEIPVVASAPVEDEEVEPEPVSLQPEPVLEPEVVAEPAPIAPAPVVEELAPETLTVSPLMLSPILGDDEHLTKCGERLPRGVICGCDICTGKA